MTSGYQPHSLPFKQELETKAILKACASAREKLAALNEATSRIPTKNATFGFFILQEAKDSSEIENIHTTSDELIQPESDLDSPAKKEVLRYDSALSEVWQDVKDTQAIRLKEIFKINEILMKRNAKLRDQMNVTIKEGKRVIFTPPQSQQVIEAAMANLVDYINDDSIDDVDTLIKMSIIHYQFETIHPFFDGNGRTGRILNMIYLMLKGKLNNPSIYLSSYILQNKANYNQLFNATRETQDFEPWLLFMINGIEQAAEKSLDAIKQIENAIKEVKRRLINETNFYSKDLLDALFQAPFIGISDLENSLHKTQPTLRRYLSKLEEIEIINSFKIKRHKIFVNNYLYKLIFEK